MSALGGQWGALGVSPLGRYQNAWILLPSLLCVRAIGTPRLTTLALLATCIRVCFPARPSCAMRGSVHLCLRRRLFVIDIVLSFRTTFKENGRWVTDGKRLALRYLKSWFILDLLSTIPFNLAIDIETLTESDTTKQVAAQQSGGARVNKLGRLVRLVKRGRIVRLFEKVPSLQKFLFTQPVITSIVGTILSLFIIWHFVACTYWFVAVTIEYDHYTFVPCPMMADRIEPKGIWMFSDYCKGYGTCILDGCDSDALKNATCIEYPLSAMNTRAHMEGGHDDSYATDLAAFAIWPWGSVSGLDTTTAMSADTYGTRSTWRAYAPNVSAHCYQDNWFRRSWLPDPWQSHDSTILQYSSSLTWAIEATTGNGGEIVPENQLEHVVTMFAIAAGIMVYACIIGSITVALSATNNDTAQKRHQIKEMNRYMKRKKVRVSYGVCGRHDDGQIPCRRQPEKPGCCAQPPAPVPFDAGLSLVILRGAINRLTSPRCPDLSQCNAQNDFRCRRFSARWSTTTKNTCSSTRTRSRRRSLTCLLLCGIAFFSFLIWIYSTSSRYSEIFRAGPGSSWSRP